MQYEYTGRTMFQIQKTQVFMKLGRNGRLFYRWCTLAPDLSTFSMHIKGTIVEYYLNSLRLLFDLFTVFLIYKVLFIITKHVNTMHTKRYPFSSIQHVACGYDLSDFFEAPLSLPSEGLGANLSLKDNRRLNLVFSAPTERDEFVSCMLKLLLADRDGH